MQNLASQDVLVRCHVAGSFSLDPIMPGGLDATKQGCDDSRCNLVLNCENILKLPVVAFSPDMRLCLAVNELNGYSYAVRDLAHATFHDIVNAEFTCDFPRLYRLTL